MGWSAREADFGPGGARRRNALREAAPRLALTAPLKSRHGLGEDRRVPFTVDRGDLAADRLRARAALPKKAGANYRNDRQRRQFRQISGLSSSSRRLVRGCLKPVVKSEWMQRITERINDLLAADLLQNFLTIRRTQPRIVLLAPETGPASRP